ncbi:hypothetical protein U9M48_041195, partial [Paspalum notatum var. saurae]
DILHHIHSLLPLRDAARAACSSRAFLRSWRCHPVLALTGYHLGLGLRKNIGVPRENFTHIIDNILSRPVSGPGIKIRPGSKYPRLILYISEYTSGPRPSYLDTKKPITLQHDKHKLPRTALCSSFGLWMECVFPCTLLSAGVRNSIRDLQLSYCAFHPTAAELGLLRNLTSLALSHRVKVSLGETLQMKNLVMQRSNSNLICYARCELPSSMPNLESLSICSYHEKVNTPMLPTKFMFLKWLFISVPSPSSSYDHFSLAYFLDASPSLETWLLDVAVGEHASIFKGSSQLRQMPEQHHTRLKTFKIKGFNSSRGLVELTCYVLKNAQSLDCLTLDTTNGFLKCDCDMSSGLPAPLIKGGATAIRTYIEDKVPPTVKLAVVDPCNQCHADIK